MVFFPVPIPAGMIKTNSPYDAAGRWIDGDKVRFRGGRVEKVGGAGKFISAQFEGFARGAHAWVAQGSFPCVVFGTAAMLYLIRNGSLTDITPFRVTDAVLTDPFATTNGSAIVTVTDNDHGITSAGTRVVFSDADAVGGIIVDGVYTVTSVIDDDSFTITHTTPASSAATGGGSVTASYHINVGRVDPGALVGWGVGPWGVGGWGMGVSAAYGVLVEPMVWTMDNYGEDLLVCPQDDTIYYYDASAGAVRPTPVLNAPARVRAVFVTPERYILALGCTTISGAYDAMSVRWPDIEDFTDWSPSSVDTSNQRRLQGGSRLIAGCGFQQGLSFVWSDSALFTFQFTGTAVIYDSRKVGDECGLIGPHAFCKTDGAVYWMSLTSFHYYNGAVTDIPNSKDIADWVFKSLNAQHAMKCCCDYNKEFNEVRFFYPSGNSTENDRYVTVCLDDFSWTIGTWDRSASAKFAAGEKRPLLFGLDGYVWAHESPHKNDNNGALAAFIESAPFDLEEGNVSLDVWGFVPDMERQVGDVEIYVYGLDHPRDGILSEDTVIIAPEDKLVDLRAAGRQIAMRLTSDVVGGDFRLGRCQLDISGAGRKRGSQQT